MRTPSKPFELGIPKNDWWPGQRETIEEILDAFIDEGKKYVMAGIPTGGGKTVVAAAIQALLARAGIGESKSLALTHTIQLQHQYVETLPQARVLIGRGNFACELPDDDEARVGYPNLTAADAPCASGLKCAAELDGPDGCAYYRQRHEAASSSMLVTNYALAPLILRPSPSSPDEKNPFRRALLIADECHLAERAVLNSDSGECQLSVFSGLNIELPSEQTKTRVMEGKTEKWYETTGVWVAWARKAAVPVARERHRLSAQLKSLRENKTQGSEAEAARVVYKLKHLTAAGRVLKWLTGLEPNDWQTVAVFRTKTQLRVQPLWGWDSAQRLLWRHFDRVLLMSATPGDPTIESIKLGIPQEEFKYIERPSIFPVRNRPIYFMPVTKLSYGSDHGAWMKMARAIAHLASQFPNKKGLVHSGSHNNAEKLTGMLNELMPGRFFTHTKDSKMTREQALEHFKTTAEPKVLVTASFTTGLDLPYIIGWQVIAKVPFGSLADEITARRRAFVASNGYKFGQAVYQAEAMNTIVQAAGRIVRAPDDSGPTFILDGNYQILHAQSYKPKFYQEAYQRVEIN